jgi:predicted TIM-barrel fold metal-dependent hydrolase
MEFQRDPVEQLREHCYVAPSYEDDVASLRDLIGVERMLFGSDFPHAEGLTEPLEYLQELEEFSPAEVQQVMRDNGLSLVA